MAKPSQGLLSEPNPLNTMAIMQALHIAGLLTDSSFRKLHPEGNSFQSHFKYLLRQNSYRPNSGPEKIHYRLLDLIV